MQRIGLLTRETQVAELKEKVKSSEALFFINFNKLTAFSFNILRNNLKRVNTTVLITKNSLIHKAFADLKIKLNGFVEAETAVVCVYDRDIVKACKALVDFSKENETLKIRGGFLKDQTLSLEDLKALAKLPSKDILLSMAVSGIASPLTSFLVTLNQVILNFLWVIQEVKSKKEK